MIKFVRSDWSDAIWVCGKCSKKIGGGFGPRGKTRLARELRKALKGGKKRRAAVGVLETRCLGVCPKDAVTVIDGANPRRWMVVKAGTDVEDVAVLLGAAG